MGHYVLALVGLKGHHCLSTSSSALFDYKFHTLLNIICFTPCLYLHNAQYSTKQHPNAQDTSKGNLPMVYINIALNVKNGENLKWFLLFTKWPQIAKDQLICYKEKYFPW